MRYVLLLVVGLASAAEAQVAGERATVEFRSYNLVPGQREAFHRLVQETLPLLARYGMDVVAHGPSLHDSSSYYLIRAFRSPDHRSERESAFYGSDDWRDGPRDRVLSLIENFTTVVVELAPATVRGLRTGTPPPDRIRDLPAGPRAPFAVRLEGPPHRAFTPVSLASGTPGALRPL